MPSRMCSHIPGRCLTPPSMRPNVLRSYVDIKMKVKRAANTTGCR